MSRVLVMCQKVKYTTKSDAKDAIKQIAFDRRKFSKKPSKNKGGRKMRVYECHLCGYWHLTTQRPNKYSNKGKKNEKNWF